MAAAGGKAGGCEKQMCKYGSECYRKNPDHLRRFAHPPPSTSATGEESGDSGSGSELGVTSVDSAPPRLAGVSPSEAGRNRKRGRVRCHCYRQIYCFIELA